MFLFPICSLYSQDTSADCDRHTRSLSLYADSGISMNTAYVTIVPGTPFIFHVPQPSPNSSLHTTLIFRKSLESHWMTSSSRRVWKSRFDLNRICQADDTLYVLICYPFVSRKFRETSQNDMFFISKHEKLLNLEGTVGGGTVLEV